jgi:hypothetical protein
MSLTTPESILIALNQRSQEVAGMFAIVKEQQGLAEGLLNRVTAQTERLEGLLGEFDRRATSKFAGALAQGLDDIGSRIATGALKESLAAAKTNANEIDKKISHLQGVSNDVAGHLNKLSIRFFLMAIGAIAVLGLSCFITFSFFIKYQQGQIFSNNARLNEQNSELSLLSERGIKIQNSKDGVMLIAPDGLTSGMCGSVQCVQLH